MVFFTLTIVVKILFDPEDLDHCLVYALLQSDSPELRLKWEQWSVIESVCIKEIFVWLPTGFWKAICYQMLPVDLQFCLSIYAVSLYC